MRASVLTAYGSPDVLQMQDLPVPVLTTPTSVRVKIHATSVNPIDWKIRAGHQRGALRYTLPRVIGMDLSGVVEEVGRGVTRFSVGDSVFASPGLKSPGTYAEQTIVEEAELAHKPSNLSHLEAASIPLVGLTAWACLMPRLTQGDQRVFIMAGAGGVGTFAIQLARHFGAHVITTCSPRNNEFLRELGADSTIDYHTTDFADVLHDVDIVLDSLGYESTTKALRIVKRGGRLASIVSGLPHNTERYGPNLGLVATGLGIVKLRVSGFIRGITAVSVLRKADGQTLEKIAELIEQGAIRPVIDRSFPLEELAAAHAYGERGHSRGKVVIEV